MTIQYLAKACYAGAITFLGAVLAVLQSSDVIETASWVAIALATLLSIGGVLGLQAAPATIATSIRE